MDGSKLIVTRRFSLDGAIIDFLAEWDPEHGTSCCAATDRAMTFPTMEEAVEALRKCQRLVPTWCQSAAERAAGITPRPICYGIARLDGDRVVSLVDAALPWELETAAH